MKEIGSEFWSNPLSQIGNQHLVRKWNGDIRYFLSGRTALYALLEDIAHTGNRKTAYLPSYCCHTMIEPFVRLGFPVDFYPVIFNGEQFQAEIDASHHCDVVLVMDYFGFTGDKYQYPPDALIIRDMTHVLLSESAVTDDADYLFASFRKWGAVAGAGAVCKNKGKFGDAVTLSPCNAEYIKKRNAAYQMKATYMAGASNDKSPYLTVFSEAEELLERDYIGYMADEASLTAASEALCEANAQLRRNNAVALIAGLEGLQLVHPVFPHLGANDVPLFVPVAVRAGKRDALRAHLIRNNVYCPVH